jgi:hypothetical protein
MTTLVEKSNVRHYYLYADEMTRSGVVTSITHSGLGKREASNVSLRAGQAAPIQVLTDAAINNRREYITRGLSSALIYGTTPYVGTMYNQVVTDFDFIARNVSNATSLLEDF